MSETQTDRPTPAGLSSKRGSGRSDSGSVLSLAIPVFTVGIGGWLLHFLLTWRIGLNIADEGYYWYGAQRVWLGEVPLRDFMSYDVGRYLWAAGWMRIFSDGGLFPTRLAAFSCVLPLLLVVLWLVLAESGPRAWWRWLWAALAVTLFLLWEQPYFKTYDVAASAMVLLMAWLMLQAAHDPHPQRPWVRWAAAGSLLGLAAVIGRNHGLYGTVAGALTAALLVRRGVPWRALSRGVPPFFAGLAAGLLPLFLLLIAAPGFATAFADSIAEQLRLGKTNLELPFPHVWDVDWSTLGLMVGSRDLLLHLLFAAVVAVPTVAVTASFLAPRNQKPLPLAAAVAAFPYSHYVVSRPDFVHLAGTIFPFLVLLLAWLVPRGWRGAAAIAAVLLASVFALSQQHPVLRYAFWPDEFITVPIDGQPLLLRQAEVDVFQHPLAVLEKHGSGPSTNFLAVPSMPALYALRRVASPVWEIYMLVPRRSDFVDRQLASLSAAPPEIVLVSDRAFDDHDDRQLSRLNPRLLSWIETRCRELPVSPDAAHLRAWRCPRQAEAAATGTPGPRPQ